MNIILELYNFNRENTQYLDTKKNIIMNGNFTKIIYSDNNFTLNGIYLRCPFDIEQIDNNIQQNIIFNLENERFFNEIIKIETYILDSYKHKNNISKHPQYLLFNQITNQHIKLYNQNNMVFNNSHTQIVLKISGIWENAEYFGLTYKFINMTNITS